METSGYDDTQVCGERIANFLRVIHPLGTAKLVAKDLRVSARTVENWLDGTSVPKLDHFRRMLGAYGPGVLLAAFPGLAWAEVLKVAFDQATLDAQIAAMPARRARAVAALRGRS